ncbi:winged helix-turn-helix domain-containing tetratricopeptide repeat protein [Bosea sp. LjRoot237]|uniref:winged helix-turn-helix domain-containing tetratricopeptide repeat protein n=1 Tax=Bosea sp. LjRoot237 TaxID=3342292 RepID=UPI003ED10480
MSGQRYTFERWLLDCRGGVLTSENTALPLRPKSFEVLRFLVENAGRVVSRQEMLDAVWPATTVTEESLTQCISEVRHVLGVAGQRIIKTVPKRGYLITAVVETADPPESRLSETTATVRDGPSVAVLPFANLSGDVSEEYLNDGISEDIINALSAFAELSVIARNSCFRYKGRAIDIREIGRELSVGYIVEGSVRRFGERIRITAQLVDARSGSLRWSERFDRTLGDIFAVQDEITDSIVRIVIAHLGSAERERVAQKPPSSWSAYDLAMRGDHAMRIYLRSWAAHDLYSARQLFVEALKADPDNAGICAKLAGTYIRAYSEPDDPDYGRATVLKRGYDLASKAVRLDPNLPLTRAQLGWALSWMSEPDAAVREFDRAFALNPNFSDVRFPAVLIYAGAPIRALEVVQAHLRLDPFHPPFMYAFQGHALYALKRYEEAVMPLRECIRRAPQVLLAHVWIAATLVRLGQYAEAKAIAAKILERSPNMSVRHWPALALYRNPEDAEHMIEALRDAGL